MSDAPTTPTTTPAPTAAAATVEDDVTTASDAAPAAAVDAAEAARLKREARKARILSKGSDRLARITNTGRGEGASAYLNDNAIPSAGASPARSTGVTPAAAAARARADDDDPLEVDVSTLSRSIPRGEEATNPFAMFGGGAGGGEGGQQDPMAALMAMMQGGGGGAFGGGPGGAQAGQMPDMSGLPPQLAAMMQQFAAGGPEGPGGANAPSITATQRKSLTERAFDLLQAFLVLALAVLAAKSSLFDTDHSSAIPSAISDTLEKTSTSLAKTTTLQRWAKLAYSPPSPAEWSASPSISSFSFLPTGFSALPLFYIFLSLEITLQALRIAIFSRKTPAPPSMLSTITMMLPIPNLALAIKLISKYLALVNAFVNDVSLLVFVFGVAVLWSGHKLGGVGMLDGAATALGVGHDEL